MARLATRQPFTPHGVFVTRKAFPFNGRPFDIGVEFPYEELGVDSDKLRKLMQAGFIRRKDEGETINKQKKSPKIEVAKSEDDSEMEEVEDNDTDEEEQETQPKKKSEKKAEKKKALSAEEKKAAKKARAAARKKKG